MSDFIDRQAVFDALIEKGQNSKRYKLGENWELNLPEIIEAINTIPSAEPERKKGHWIDTDNYYQRWKCSECGCHTRDAEPNFCPWCGVDMRGNHE